MVSEPKIVNFDQWFEAGREFKKKEEELFRHTMEVAEARRRLPRLQIEKEYFFDGVDGRVSLADLFDGKSQLIIQHFMYGADWDEPCPRCSGIADCHSSIHPHLNARDINLVAVSNGPLDKLQAHKKRMGWSFDWYSCLGTDFGFDFGVSYLPEHHETGVAYYNFEPLQNKTDELSGVSCFIKDTDNKIYRTYSAYREHLMPLLNFYSYMDISPKGRNEDPDKIFMSWINFKDKYDAS